MIGIGGAIEIGLMARITGSGRICVGIVGMALRAGQRSVRTRQRIVRVERMIEIDVCPVRCGVAYVAGGGESGGSVTRVGCPIPIGLMAAETIGRQRCVVIVGVALCAG